MMYWFMSRCHNKDISNNVIFAFKNVIIERMTLQLSNMHKPYFIFITYVMIMKVSL